MELSFIKWEDLQLFFISPSDEDLILANDILEQKKFDTHKLDELIDDLNVTYRDWHFFMEDCRIKRVRAQNIIEGDFKLSKRLIRS
jgi:hypothetical protein